MEHIVLQSERLDEKVYVYTHKSGLKIYISPKKRYAKKCAYFAANYGSMDVFYEHNGEKHEIPDGLAHFLEHKRAPRQTRLRRSAARHIISLAATAFMKI